MKKMSIESTKKSNGGRWKCGYCGAKYWVYAAAWGHQHLTGGRCSLRYVFGGEKISWCW